MVEKALAWYVLDSGGYGFAAFRGACAAGRRRPAPARGPAPPWLLPEQLTESSTYPASFIHIRHGCDRRRLRAPSLLKSHGTRTLRHLTGLNSSPLSRSSKCSATPVRYTKGNRIQPVDEIRFGGMNINLAFNSTIAVAR